MAQKPVPKKAGKQQILKIWGDKNKASLMVTNKKGQRSKNFLLCVTLYVGDSPNQLAISLLADKLIKLLTHIGFLGAH